MNFFEHVDQAPIDPIFGINLNFKNDTRKHKVNLGVGTYKTEKLQPYVLPSVKKAEALLLKSSPDKEYLPIDGDPLFLAKVKELVFGKEHLQRIASLQSIGGTGGLRVGANFLNSFGFTRIFLPNPTWDNHKRIFMHAGFFVDYYPYYSTEEKGFDFEAMCDAIKKMPPKSVILLHGSCHNPTGVDPTMKEWKELSSLISKHGIFPFFDVAYQGFGEGMEEDAAPLRLFVNNGIEALIATSYSKNFGLYAERVGALFAHTNSASQAEKACSQLKVIVRGTYSNPPCHGVRIVSTILSDAKLKAEWESELGKMRTRIQEMRSSLIKALHLPAYNFLKRQKGMFSYTGLSKESVARLTSEFAIYLPQDGRINVAGLNEENLMYVVQAIKAVT